jgi:unsaturated rhamnogalacturonyl hydrolase
LLTQATTQKDKPFVYYTGAVWNKANVLTTASAWFSYLEAYKNRIENPLKVIVK